MGPTGDSPLPREVAKALPSDPNALLDIAARITALALAEHSAATASEARELRAELSARDRTISSLQERVDALEGENAALEASLRACEGERGRLWGERAALIESVKQLNDNIRKLEAFKRTLLQSLQDETPSAPSASDDGDSLVHSILSRAQPPEPDVKRHPPSSHPSEPRQGYPAPAAAFRGGQTSYETPRSGTIPSYRPAASSEPHLDGKDFFKQARSRLSHEQFGLFLDNIKELNAGKKSREVTLEKARDIFGSANQDLYGSFEQLLSRHLSVA